MVFSSPTYLPTRRLVSMQAKKAKEQAKRDGQNKVKSLEAALKKKQGDLQAQAKRVRGSKDLSVRAYTRVCVGVGRGG